MSWKWNSFVFFKQYKVSVLPCFPVYYISQYGAMYNIYAEQMLVYDIKIHGLYEDKHPNVYVRKPP